MGDIDVTLLNSQLEAVKSELKVKIEEIDSLRGGLSPDKHQSNVHTDPMSTISREELNAKLEAIEARMDARVSSIGGKIDAFLAAQVERDKVLDVRDDKLLERVKSSIALSDEWNQKFRILSERSVEASLSADDSAKQAATLKNHFWASVAAQLLAVAALVVGAYFANQANIIGIASSTLSAYQAGKGDAQVKTPQEPTPPSIQR